MSTKVDEYKRAEALGKLQTTTEALEATLIHEPDEDSGRVFDSPDEFELAVGRAKMGEDTGPIFVSERLMKYIMKGRKDKSVVYKGIRCYVDGSKATMDQEEMMNAESRHNYDMKKLFEEKHR